MKFVKPTVQPTMNVLLYGQEKTGKTIGACTAPKGVMLLNCDVGNASRQAHLRNPDGSVMEPEVAPYKRGTQPVMDLMIEITHVAYQDNQDFIKTVVVDPVGELYRRLLEEVADRAIRPTLNQYGDVATHVERFCRALCMAPNVNAVFVCHELSQKDEESGGFERIAFTGTKAGSEVLSGKLMSMVDIIGYTGLVQHEDGSKEWMAQLVQGKGRRGGDRFACLGEYQPLDLTNWLEIVREHESTIRPKANGKPAVSTLTQPPVTNDETHTSRISGKASEEGKQEPPKGEPKASPGLPETEVESVGPEHVTVKPVESKPEQPKGRRPGRKPAQTVSA